MDVGISSFFFFFSVVSKCSWTLPEAKDADLGLQCSDITWYLSAAWRVQLLMLLRMERHTYLIYLKIFSVLDSIQQVVILSVRQWER